MKEAARFFGIHLFIILFFSVVSAQDFKLLRDGIEYAEITRGTEKEPIRAQLLRLDLRKVRLDVVHAMDAAIGVEKTSSIAARHGAFAAINAGFFRLDTSIFAGDAVGVLKINNELLSESYSGRVALMIANLSDRTQVFIDRANISYFIEISKKSFDVGKNRERKENDLVLFAKSFGQTTLTDGSGVEFVIRNRKVVQIFDKKGSNQIPPDGYVLSASGKMREKLLSLVKIETKLKIFGRHSSPSKTMPAGGYSIAEDVVGGVPQLIKNGKIEITWQEEKAAKDFVEKKHPRTAVAKLKDGKFLMLTVDGRQENYSVGMNLQELAELLLELGAIDAMNLDGGGSTAMFVDGKIVNRPSDKEGERRVSDAILVFPR